LGQAYAYGLLLGPIALPCSGPFLVALLAISVGIVDGVARVGSFVVFGLGFGLPLVAVAAIGEARGRALSRLLARHHDAVLRAAGMLVLVTALYELLAAGLLQPSLSVPVCEHTVIGHRDGILTLCDQRPKPSPRLPF